ncbi:hypothetical protein [Halorubrum sp. FL23]|uniref:hypothetical protein n=1 Tax=Halorubrum sp. FL23 TaxID=3458704 RepID=UPI00403391FC
MPVPVEELTADELLPVTPESNLYKALSFTVTHYEYGFTPDKIVARTDGRVKLSRNARRREYSPNWENQFIYSRQVVTPGETGSTF